MSGGAAGSAPGRIGTRRVYHGRVISVDLDHVRFPDGTTGELEIIRHPGASAIVPFLDDPGHEDPRIILLRQYRYAGQQFLREIPAGRLEPGETPRACAERELHEETGYHAAQLDALFSMFTTPGFTDERIHVFRAHGLSSGAVQRERDEFIEVETVTLSAAVAMVRAGDIQDAKTALSLLHVWALRLAG